MGCFSLGQYQQRNKSHRTLLKFATAEKVSAEFVIKTESTWPA